MTPLIKALAGAILWAVSASAQVAVIAHKDVPFDSVTKAQLTDFYSYELKMWKKNLPVVVVDLRLQSEIKDAFYKFLGMTASRMKSIWLKKMLMGEGVEPLAVKSEEEMLHKVASTPGALGFVDARSTTNEVKILFLIATSGKQP